MQDGEDNMELSFASVADHFRYPHSKPCHRLMGKKNNIAVLAFVRKIWTKACSLTDLSEATVCHT